MRFLIAGGGTGGHVFPGVGLANALKNRNKDCEILFVGTRQGVEVREVPKAGFNLRTFETVGFKGKSLSGKLKALTSLPGALIDSISVLREFKPQVVIGVGGYASAPVLIAAWLLRIKRGVIEPNAVPGLTNRLLGKYFVEYIWGAFEETRRYFPRARYEVTGMPIREGFKQGSLGVLSRDPNLIVVLGGSLGAKAFNEQLPGVLSKIKEKVSGLKVIHQTGQKDLDAVKGRYAGFGEDLRVLPFIENMAEVYAQASLVIARAGAGTCAELTAVGAPALLIPFPFAADNHQFENAKILSKAGAAVLLEQSEASFERLLGQISHLILDLKSLENMANKSKSLGKYNAADIVAGRVLELC